MLNKIRNQTLVTKSFAQYIIIIIRIVLTDQKSIHVGKFFFARFFSRKILTNKTDFTKFELSATSRS